MLKPDTKGFNYWVYLTVFDPYMVAATAIVLNILAASFLCLYRTEGRPDYGLFQSMLEAMMLFLQRDRYLHLERKSFRKDFIYIWDIIRERLNL